MLAKRELSLDVTEAYGGSVSKTMRASRLRDRVDLPARDFAALRLRSVWHELPLLTSWRGVDDAEAEADG